MFKNIKKNNPGFTKTKFFGVYLGNVFEHYDTALYGFLSPFLATIFFPEAEYIVALIWTLALIPIGKLAKPVGSLYFGYLGDTKGRKHALILSLLGMSLATACMGILPTYYQAGVLSPILLVITRMAQNFFAGGGIGASMFVLEDLENDGDKDFTSGLYSTSTILGILLASFLVSILYAFDFVEQGWRLLYLLGLLTGACGLALRKRSNMSIETPASNFLSQIKELWYIKDLVLRMMFVSGFSYACYSMAFVMINGFVPMISSITKSDIITLNTYLLVLDFALLPLFGKMTRFCSRDISMGLAASAAVLFSSPLFLLLDHCQMASLIFVRIFIVTVGVWFSATESSYALSLFPAHLRATAYAFSSSFGSQVLGSTTASISIWMYHQTHIVSSACWYLMLLGGITSCFLLLKVPKKVQIEV